MYSEKALSRIEAIEKKIGFIRNIVEEIIDKCLPIILESTRKILQTTERNYHHPNKHNQPLKEREEVRCE